MTHASTHGPGLTAGLVLAAGAGRRFGRPKALVEWDGTALLPRAVGVLADGGAAPVLAVLGAGAEHARPLLPGYATAVTAQDWAQGMGASLRTGLAAVAAWNPAPEAVLVHLVDLPDVGPDVVGRMVALAGTEVVARATYGGRPGHPVVFGRRWWDDIAAALAGDTGARGWLAGRDDLLTVECGDLASGIDVDVPGDLPGRRRGA